MERDFCCAGRGMSGRFADEIVASILLYSCVAIAAGLIYSERQVICEYIVSRRFGDKVFSSLQYSAAVENADPIGLEFDAILVIVFTCSPD